MLLARNNKLHQNVEQMFRGVHNITVRTVNNMQRGLLRCGGVYGIKYLFGYVYEDSIFK